MTLLAQSQPAGGAAIGEIVIATGMATIVTTILLVLGLGHRTGRVNLLGRVADYSERVSGMPGWAALPAAVSTVSLLTAVFGMYWDIGLHIGVGRDEGPLANPAHYFILIGLFGIFAAGFLAMVLPKERATPTSVRIVKGWDAPLGGVLICACGAFSLIGFPLDDFWHRLFGQDVTLWGPTHLMLIGGASMTLVGMAILIVEGVRAKEAAGEKGQLSWIFTARRVALTGGLLIGLSTFQAEFDFGVPQFRFVFQPMMIMLAAGVALVATRLWVGPGAALGAVGFFIAVRGFLTLMVGPVLGEPTPWFALYIVEALIVEAVVWRVGRERPLAVGLWSGLGIGTVGFAAEWAWTHLVMPLPWPTELVVPEGFLFAFPIAIAGSLIGAWIGSRLASDEIQRPVALRQAVVVFAGVIAVLTCIALYKPGVEGVTATLTLQDVKPAPEREVAATVQVNPPDAADGAEWLTTTSWQGGGLRVSPLEEVGEGRFRTTEPIPVHGNWKGLIRMHRGNTLSVVPVFLPRDEAIPAPEVPARSGVTRTFVADHEVLQREQKNDVSPVVTVLAYAVVAAIALGLLALLAWGLHRLASVRSPRLGDSARRGAPSGREVAGGVEPVPSHG